MKEVFYKGESYQYDVIELEGRRHFQLFKNGELKHFVDQSELDIKSIVSLILDSYYRATHYGMRKATKMKESV